MLMYSRVLRYSDLLVYTIPDIVAYVLCAIDTNYISFWQ